MIYRTLFLLAGTIVSNLIFSAHAEIVLKPTQNSPFQFQISGSSEQTTVVEASGPDSSWIPIQTNAPGLGTVAVTDWHSHDYPNRFYRVRAVEGTQIPQLGDLTQLNNSVFMAGEGFDVLQYAPNGKLGLIAWRGRDLIYRERNGTTWTEHNLGGHGATYVPGPSEEYRFQPHAFLLFDSQSRAHVLRLSGSSFAHHVQQGGGNFSNEAAIPVSASSFSLATAAIGPNDKLHLALVGSGNSPALTYGSNKNGSWQWTQVTTISGNPRGFLKQSFAPRWFTMAVDAQNNAHLTFCPQFAMPVYTYARPYSELHYASNAGGSWSTQKISSTADDSGDVGAGASIAIGPDNQPSIANWFNDRAATGSSQYSQLHYFKRQSNGTWSKQTVATQSENYNAGDGNRGAGFAPYLRFDAQGRPNIAFCDDASQHWSTGQNEYAGNLRHAYWNGSQWNIRNVFQQSAPLEGQIVYPAFATSGNEMVFMGLRRQTAWIDSRRANSTYNLFFIQSALP